MDKDVVRDAFDAADGPRRRIHPHVTGKELVGAARRWPYAWAKMVAFAKHKAALIRGTQDTGGWERNPFQWEVEGQMHRAFVAFEWTWKGAEEMKSEIVEAQLGPCCRSAHGHLVPLPSSLCGRLRGPVRECAKELQARIERIAATYVLCRYLGERQGDRFEPDPSKWLICGTTAKVWFEWEHVTINGQPHRVSLIVNNIPLPNTENPKRLPGNPLSRTPLSLIFSIEYLQKFADQKCPGAKYEGFVSGRAAPEIEPSLPNGGKNIQRLPLVWSLPPDGRCLNISLIELDKVTSFDAPSPDSDEARHLCLIFSFCVSVDGVKCGYVVALRGGLRLRRTGAYVGHPRRPRQRNRPFGAQNRSRSIARPTVAIH